MNKKLSIQAGGALRGEITVPGDKSISHRSVMLASIAKGNSKISNLLKGDDVICTMVAMRALGVRIEENNSEVIVHGSDRFSIPKEPVYLGNSGTGIRLLSGLFCALNIAVEFVGDASLNSRPMKRITDPLLKMGFDISTGENDTAPLKIKALEHNPILEQDFEYHLPMASAQVKSCILLARLKTPKKTIIHQPEVTRNHTELMLKSFGVDIEYNNQQIVLKGGEPLKAIDIEVPGDISSATFFIVAATIVADSKLIISNVGINPTRIGILNLLKEMGANIQLTNKRLVGEEPVADIVVQSAELKGITIKSEYIPLAIDEFPVFFIAAACAKGTTHLRGAEELRSKESDRLKLMADALKAMSIEVTEYEDGITIVGGKLKAPNGVIDSQHDHRIAMSLSVAGMTLSDEKINISGCQTINTSFPNFVELSQSLGVQIQ